MFGKCENDGSNRAKIQIIRLKFRDVLVFKRQNQCRGFPMFPDGGFETLSADCGEALVFHSALFRFFRFDFLLFLKPLFEFHNFRFGHEFSRMKVNADPETFRNRSDDLMPGCSQVVHPENLIRCPPSCALLAGEDNPVMLAGGAVKTHDELPAFQFRINARFHSSGFPVHVHKRHNRFLHFSVRNVPGQVYRKRCLKSS